MCALCAAVPTIAALGIAAEGEQRRHQRACQARGVSPPRQWRPRTIRGLTVVGMLIVFVLAALYHTQPPSGT